jgi:hypothetical protein
MQEINIENFYKDSFKNRSKIKQDEKVSCYYCCTSYLGKYITRWTDDDTVICDCGIDSVVPYEVSEEVLKKAHKKWFGSDEEEEVLDKFFSEDNRETLKNIGINIPESFGKPW